jgi:hypothetical protein
LGGHSQTLGVHSQRTEVACGASTLPFEEDVKKYRKFKKKFADKKYCFIFAAVI